MRVEATAGTTVPVLLRDRYEVVRTLGRGGQATVFLAWDAELELWRALKLAAPDADPACLARFRREGRVLARLAHLHVLAVHDVFPVAHAPCLVMDHASGGSLSERLRRHGALAPAQVATVGTHCAAALAHAHRHGVLHRDIKPANVLVHADGTCVLSDFGIAHGDGESTHMTRPGMVLGTPAYLAPEVRSGALDAHVGSDVYALGATLLVLATGDRDPPLVHGPTTLARLPDPLADLIERCCCPDPELRPSSMDDVRELLAEALRACPPVPPDVPALGAVPPASNPAVDPHLERLRLRIAAETPTSLEDRPPRLVVPYRMPQVVRRAGLPRGDERPSVPPYAEKVYSPPAVTRTVISAEGAARRRLPPRGPAGLFVAGAVLQGIATLAVWVALFA